MIFVKAINEEVSFLKKKEAVFIGALLVISVVLCIFVYAVPHGTHGSIQITVDGELYGTYSLAEDQVIQIGDTNVCEIKDGEVKMTEADCRIASLHEAAGSGQWQADILCACQQSSHSGRGRFRFTGFRKWI